MSPGAFEPIKNPYIVGNPIKGSKMFFGRDDDFQYIRSKFMTATDGGLVVLCGARRSGKTSMLFQIRDGRLGEDYQPVLIDMQSMAVENDEDFLQRIIEIVCEVIPGSSACRARPDELDSKRYSFFILFLKRVTESLGERRLILTFDEYELFENYIDGGVLGESVLNMFANLIEYGNMKVIFTGSDNLEGRNKPYWDVFLSKALHRRISFLSPKDTLRLITEPVRGLVEYDAGVPEAIARLTAGQPFYTQVVCQSVIDSLNELRRHNLSESDLDAVVEDIIENPLPQMIFHWNAYSPLEKTVMAIASDIEQTGEVTGERIVENAREQEIGYRLDEQAVNKALESLFHGDMLSKVSDAGAFEFRMGLWRKWIARMHSVWQVIDEFEQEDVDLEDSGMERIDKGASTRRKLLFGAIALVVALGGALVGSRVINQGGTVSTQLVSPGSVPSELAATVRIDTEPTDADVWVDGVLIGKSPFDGTLPAGTLSVDIRKEGFIAHADTISVAAKDTAAFSYVLVEQTGTVSVTSDPAGADVYVDGKQIAEKTPVSLTFPVSQRPDIRLAYAGYNARNFAAVAIHADSTTTLSHRFSKRTAPLTVSADQPGAAVSIDGEPRGTVPVVIEALSWGEHDIEVTHFGYHTSHKTITVPITGNRFEVTLAPLPPGFIILGVQPVADISVDGTVVRRGAQFYRGPHAVGPVTIEFVNEHFGKQTWSREVTSGDTLRIFHKFE